MKGRMKSVICCTATMVLLAMTSSVTALAAGDTPLVGIPALTGTHVEAATRTVNSEIQDSKWAYRTVADVETQVNIRAAATTDSEIVGYLPKGAAADIVERGEEWSHINSGGLEGYIKNEYLAFGKEAKELAEVYGTPGVTAKWDDVNVFAEPDAAAKILATVNGGTEYEILEKQELWYEVQFDDATTAYVAAEDVEEEILLERAISVVTAPADSEDEETSADTSDWEQDYVQEETPVWNETPEEEYTPEETEEAPSEETVVNASADDVSLLAAIIYCEAGNQSREGKVAVGAVVMNRVASSSFPNTIREVIYQSGQFTPAFTGGLASALANGVPADCYEAAQAALNGENPVGNALYFNTGSGRGIKIGAHQFY